MKTTTQQLVEDLEGLLANARRDGSTAETDYRRGLTDGCVLGLTKAVEQARTAASAERVLPREETVPVRAIQVTLDRLRNAAERVREKSSTTENLAITAGALETISHVEAMIPVLSALSSTPRGTR